MLGVGVHKAMPVNFPFSSGLTLPTALAMPVDASMMFWTYPRPSNYSLSEGQATHGLQVAMMAWTVVMSPFTMPKLSRMTLTKEAKQLVVQKALLTILQELSNVSLTRNFYSKISMCGSPSRYSD